MIDTSSINRGKSPTHFTSSQTSGSTCATCNRNFYRLHIFNKLEVSGQDSTLSSFVIISLYIRTLSWCRIVVRSSRNWKHLTVIQTSHHLVKIQITFKTIRTPATKEFEQGNLNVKRTILH